MSAVHPAFGQRLTFHDLGSEGLKDTLALEAPSFASDDVFKQLTYLEGYLKAPEIAAETYVVEEHYIDRDHMEDHSVFYARSFFPYPNHCRRVHFFRGAVKRVRARLRRLLKVAQTKGVEAYKKACAKYSDEAYLGFSIIRPLNGSPVGRTVVRCFPQDADGGQASRQFLCTRKYTVHLAGVELYVRGLPFQQQDKAVAACATTAIWSSLHMVREHEEIATTSPAQITVRASQTSLPFGRPMPSEGLSIDQMCQAIHAAGVSPVLQLAHEFETTRALLHSALQSRVSPALILKRAGADGRDDWHAVSVAGMKVVTGPVVPVGGIADRASLLRALYIHDDRFGPYLRADLVKGLAGRRSVMNVWLRFTPDKSIAAQAWQLTHMIFPVHSKIRISFATLRLLALDVVDTMRAVASVLVVNQQPINVEPIEIDAFIQRSHRYMESLLEEQKVGYKTVSSFAASISLARYVGVIRTRGQGVDPIDVVVDTTSTDRNPQPIAVVALGSHHQWTAEVVDYLASVLDCWAVL